MDWKTRVPALILWFALVFSAVCDGNSEQRIVCYYTNWSVYRPGTAKFSPQNINPYLCTHLIYAFGGFTKENTLKPFDKYQDIEKGGYAKFTGLKTYNKNLKTMLAIGGWNEGSSRFSPMVADPGRRKEFVKNSVKFLRQNHFDGLDLDWEYPAFRDGGKPRDRNNYADLVQELREEFERESSKTGRPRLLLSMAVPAGIEYIDKGYDVPRLNDYLDFINLLSYDYHSAFEPAVNHHAPLYPLEEANEYNYDTELTIDYTIEHLLKSGASSEKIVLGIPTYGRSYTLFNEEATEIGAPADGPGEEGDATREKGYLAYYEICESVAKSDEWEVVQPNPSAMGPYAFREKQWVGYDDEDIVRAKARYVNEKKLGGIMFWSIDNDDFRGKCHGRPYPLIEAAKEAYLAGDEKTSSGPKTKLSDNRKKTRIQAGQRIQGNTIGRKLSTGNRRTTTQASSSRRRITSSRSNGRTNPQGRRNKADEEEEDEDDEGTNVVKTVEKRTRVRSKSRPKNRGSSGGRRKQQGSSRRNEDDKEAEATNENSLSNRLTTPEPPTTPDPGSDFKCEDEGFFPHPRDCKKYFWCLDSGPSGLGIVAHQFTCPSGLVFNKAADSCDYPRNVVCPKAKPSQSTVTTTKAPVTAATSKTTYLYKPAQRTTTSKPESEEEYEYYDDEEVTDSEEVVEEPRITTSAKPLLYKTISRSRPTTTTTAAPVTTTTEASTTSYTRTYKTTSERDSSFEDEEDPRVIKELIDLIKKAGGIEQLEKQLNYQEKNSGSDSGTTEVNGSSTPATISRSLYERVLNRQATRLAGGILGSFSTTQSTINGKSDREGTKNTRNRFVNGPGGAQFQGLDDVPEVKSLRRTNKPQYVTIERNRTPTSESPAEDDEEIEDEIDEDNTNVASSEDSTVSKPPNQRTSTRRVTPSYVNIRRPRPSTTTSENDVEVKDDEEAEEEEVPQRHRVVKTEEESSKSSSPKFRYTNTQRFRSTTSKSNEEDETEEVSVKNNPTTESTTTTTTTTTTEKVIPVEEETEEAPSSTTQSSTTAESSSPSTAEDVSSSLEFTTFSIPESTSDSSLKLVENSATEILFTTLAASSSSSESSQEPFTRGPSIPAVSQPRPFGFPRRGRPTASSSSVAPVTEQSRTKVVSETLRLPTLKELVGYTATQTESIPEFTSAITQSSPTFVNRTIDKNALRDEQIDRKVSKVQRKFHSQGSTENDREKEILDNDILGSEEIPRRSASSSFVYDPQFVNSTNDIEEIDSKQSIKRVEIPVRILDDANGEEIADLVILRLPENKLNSAILKPVFRVKVLERDEKNQASSKRDRNESIINEHQIRSENEVPDDQRQSSRRRRVKYNSSTTSATFEVSGDRVTAGRRSRNRQRIVKARRRTRVREVTSSESGESVSINLDNEKVQGNRKNSDANVTTGYSTESTTAIKATTLRGNLSSTSKPTNIIRGFYVTKSSVETSTIPDVTTTDSSIDSMQYQAVTTGNDSLDETTEKTDFATQSHETIEPLMERNSYVADVESTYESIGTTQSSRELETLVGENLETATSGMISTIDDRFRESDLSTIIEEGTTEQPEVTTFRPSTIDQFQTTDSAIWTVATTSEKFTDEIDKAVVKKPILSIDDLSENLKASANSHYGGSSNYEVESTTLTTIPESDDNHLITTWQTEPSVQKTTMLDEKATTYKGAFNRGKVRFSAAPNSEASKLSHSENRENPVKLSGVVDENLEVNRESHRRRTLTKVNIESIEHDLIDSTESTQNSRVRSRNNRRRTTASLKIDPTTNSASEKLAIVSSTESYDKTVGNTIATPTYEETDQNTPKAENLSTNTMKTIGTELDVEDFRKSTNSITDSDVITIDSGTGRISTKISTESYGKLTEYQSVTPEINESTTNDFQSTGNEAPKSEKSITNPDEFTIDSVTAGKLTTNFVETVETERYSDLNRKTTKSISDSDDFTIDSATGKNSVTPTEIYGETIYYTSEAPEVTKLTTNFIETSETDSYSEQNQKSKSASDPENLMNQTTENYFFTTAADVYDKIIENSSEANDLSTNFFETTESHPYTNSLSDETDSIATTTESYDGITETLKQEENQTESIMNIGTTLSLAEIINPVTYGNRNRVTNTFENDKTDSISITKDVTVDIKTETFASTTEAYSTTDRTEIITSTGIIDSETAVDSQYGTSAETVQQTTETMTNIDTNVTKELFTATPSASTIYNKSEETTITIPADTTIGKISESTTKESPLKDSGVTNSENNAYSTIDSSTNTIAPVTPREIKHYRGRVKFTDFAGSIDETGKVNKPIKQVIVRRRLAKTDLSGKPRNHHRNIDETSETDTPKNSRHPHRHRSPSLKENHPPNLKEQPTEEKNSTNITKQLSEENNNSTTVKDQLTNDKIANHQKTKKLKNDEKPTRRRVVVYRGRSRAELVPSTTTMQSLSSSSDEIPDDKKRTRKRTWRKRIVLKRPRNEEPDDLSIAETSDFRRSVIDDSDFRNLGTDVEDHEFGRSAESADEDTNREVNPLYRSSGGFLRRPGSLIRKDGINRQKNKSQGNAVPINPSVVQPAVFSRIQPTVESIRTNDQSGRAQELTVTRIDPPANRSSTPIGRLPFRTTTRKISTTIAPRTEAPTILRTTTPINRRRQRPRGNSNDRVIEIVTTRPRRPAIIDYDYYFDEEDVRIVLKPELKDKIFVTRKGGIRCLDQGNFAHPTSCKKFITCARMVNGQVVGTEYTCPDKLSFDPVGGICNWSAGVGCEEKKA